MEPHLAIILSRKNPLERLPLASLFLKLRQPFKAGLSADEMGTTMCARSTEQDEINGSAAYDPCSSVPKLLA